MRGNSNVYSGPVPQNAPEGDGLTGIAQIGLYSGFRDERTIKRLVRELGFPMVAIAGVWVSSKIMVDHWRREQVRKSCQAVNGPHLTASEHHLSASAHQAKNVG